MIFFVNLNMVVGVLIVKSFFHLNVLRPFFINTKETLNSFIYSNDFTSPPDVSGY